MAALVINDFDTGVGDWGKMVQYPGVDKEYARERLGLGPAKPPKWYSIEAGWATKIEGLDELKIGLYLSE